MRTINLPKVLKVLAYVVLLLISTWATVESAQRLLPGWPPIFLWALSIIFFCIASYGAKLIIASLNQSVRTNGRIYKLVGGLALVLFFWIGIILPTNTHTFFYKSIIAQTTIEEIKYTETQLDDFKLRGKQVIIDEKNAFEQKILREISNYQHEILNIGDPGAGVRAETILSRIENNLGSDVKIVRLTLPSKKQSVLMEYSRQMESIIKGHLRAVLQQKFDRRLADNDSTFNKKEINNLLVKLKEEKIYIDKHQQPRIATRNLLIDCFAMIARYSDRLYNKPGSSNSLITASRTPKIIDLEKVTQVWKNFFRSEYSNMGFGYWILVALLIDLAGFVMFALAFKKNEYSN